MILTKNELVRNQQLRQRDLNEGHSLIYSISDAGSLFNLSEEDFFDYLMRLGIISVGFKQNQESIEKGWFLDDSLEPYAGNVNKPDTYLSPAALKSIFSILIDNNLIYYAELVSKPFSPRRIDQA